MMVIVFAGALLGGDRGVPGVDELSAIHLLHAGQFPDESKELFLPFRLIGMNAARDGEQIAVIQIERSPAGDVQFAGLVQDFIDELIRRFRREFRIRCGEIEGEFLEFAAAFFLADSFVHSSLAPIVDYTPASVAL